MNDDKPVKKLSNDEKYAALLGIMACISAMENIPDGIGILISQRAVALLEKSWDAIPPQHWENVQKILVDFDNIKANEKQKRKEYYEKHSH